MADQIISKRCSVCKQNKPLSEFHKASKNKDRHQAKCKSCAHKYTISQEFRDYFAKYKKTDNYKISTKIYKRKYRKANRQRTIAHYKIRNAIISGKLSSVSKYHCRICWNQAQEYHHPDYSKPFDVIPLCISCHRTIHKSTA